MSSPFNSSPRPRSRAVSNGYPIDSNGVVFGNKLIEIVNFFCEEYNNFMTQKGQYTGLPGIYCSPYRLPQTQTTLIILTPTNIKNAQDIKQAMQGIADSTTHFNVAAQSDPHRPKFIDRINTKLWYSNSVII